jgi:small multidrug resistance pump
MNGNYYLIGTIILETLAVVLMKLSNGHQNKFYFISGLVAFLISFVLLSQALKTLAMGYTNAIWAGSSIVLVYIVSMVIFDEKVSLVQSIFILFIILGIVGLNITKG